MDEEQIQKELKNIIIFRESLATIDNIIPYYLRKKAEWKKVQKQIKKEESKFNKVFTVILCVIMTLIALFPLKVIDSYGIFNFPIPYLAPIIAIVFTVIIRTNYIKKQKKTMIKSIESCIGVLEKEISETENSILMLYHTGIQAFSDLMKAKSPLNYCRFDYQYSSLFYLDYYYGLLQNNQKYMLYRDFIETSNIFDENENSHMITESVNQSKLRMSILKELEQYNG